MTNSKKEICMNMPSAVLLLSGLICAYSPIAYATAGQGKDHVVHKSPAACNKQDQTVHLTGKRCDDYPFDPVQISCLLPADVQGKLLQPNFNNRQRASDLFSWQSFVAFNWPASKQGRGRPAANLPIDAQRKRVWETWKETEEIFLKHGKRPARWDRIQPILLARAERSGCAADKVLYRSSKVSEVLSLNNSLQPTKADGTLPGTLTSQDGEVVRYEIRYNKTAFDYIVANELYNADHQNIVNEVRFPPGSTLVKAAWLPLKDRRRTSRLLTSRACVCDAGKSNSLPSHGCKDEIVGLVGFHVMTKTESAPQWMWSTFEQVDNVKNTSGTGASFNKENCLKDGQPCATNKQTAIGVPNQIVRTIKIPDTASCESTEATDNLALLNRNMQKALAAHNSPLQYYELVNTQWPVPASPGSNLPDTVFTPVPALLGNTTLETFIQPTSSCMGCHAMARSTRLDRFVSADFTFTLDNAHPHQKNPNILPAPTASDSDSVNHGYRLMNNTYEMLPDNVNAKLHCSSCHLNAGRNPAASWLVDMKEAYALVEHEPKVLTYPESLYARINGCFTRSMNGEPLCDISNNDCSTNKHMQGLKDYTEWLTGQRDKKFDSDSPRGFPQLPLLAGDAGKGRGTYLQKCAFCHGEDGQGRYEHDTYYRPALWGKDSYNACAGMAREPGTGKGTHLAGFLKANMPLHSGGVLTDQEAWNLAIFINGHCRPGKSRCLENLYPTSAYCAESIELGNPNFLPVHK